MDVSERVDPTATGIVESRGGLPDDPPPGDYVVVDVTHFSTTVVQLLAAGAACVHVPESEDGALAFRRSRADALAGCEHAQFAVSDRFDFPNSPSYVDELEVAGRPTSLVTTNGAATVDDLRGTAGVSVFVAGYANAGAVAAYLGNRDRTVTLVACGAEGDPTVDDLLGTVVVDRYLRGRPPDDVEKDQFAHLLVASKGPDYGDAVERRRRDLTEYATAIDRHWIVPRLDGDCLVDATRSDAAAESASPAEDATH